MDKAEKVFNSLIAKGPGQPELGPKDWTPGYYEARAYGTDEDNRKTTIYSHTGRNPEEAIQALRLGVVFGRPDFKVESICVYECKRIRVYQ